MAIVTVVGSGMMGSALAFPACENGHTVRLVGTHLDREIIDTCRKTNRHPRFTVDFPRGVEFYRLEELEQALTGADMVIGGVSSFGVEWFGDYVLPRLQDGVPLLTVTKGLWDTSEGKLLTYPDLWQKKLEELGKDIPLNAIGGPCTSYELAARDHSHVAFCGKDMEVLKKLRDIMQCSFYHVSITTNVTGIETAVALKNGFSLGVAMAIGLQQKESGDENSLRFNSQAAVFGQGMKEMSRILTLQGCNDLDCLSTGVGDMYVTIYGGRTRKIGILLGRGYSLPEAQEILAGETLESLVVAERVGRAISLRIGRGELKAEDFPLLLHTHRILTEGIPADMPWQQFTFEA